MSFGEDVQVDGFSSEHPSKLYRVRKMSSPSSLCMSQVINWENHGELKRAQAEMIVAVERERENLIQSKGVLIYIGTAWGFLLQSE